MLVAVISTVNIKNKHRISQGIRKIFIHHHKLNYILQILIKVITLNVFSVVLQITVPEDKIK